jgi:hypothetical protein
MIKYKNYILPFIFIFLLPFFGLHELIEIPSKNELKNLDVDGKVYCESVNNYFKVRLVSESSEYLIRSKLPCIKIDGIKGVFFIKELEGKVWEITSKGQFKISYEELVKLEKKDAITFITLSVIIGLLIIFFRKIRKLFKRNQQSN